MSAPGIAKRGGAGLDRRRLVPVADWLAVALAASLPWSTSATGILVVLWLAAALPTLDVASVRRAVFTPAGGLPVLLWMLGVIGMLWADVSWSERLHGLGGFHKLLVIPLLIVHFRTSGRGREVLLAFVGSCAALLAASWLTMALPALTPAGKAPGVPVKDYVAQSAVFTVCIMVLAYRAADLWQAGSRRMAVALALLATVFLVNIFYAATSRTALVVVPLLFVVFGFVRFRWRGMVALLGAFLFLAAAAWPSATFLQTRVLTLFQEVTEYRSDAAPTSAGERLEYWRKSVAFIAEAPLVGHGTGSIEDQFRRVAGTSGMAANVADNPHNQTLTVAIQLGAVGALALWAMWGAHLLLFRGAGLAAWAGLMVVGQNLLGSLFNSHLFDFTHGWLYVVGVGIAGGVVLRNAARADPASP